MKVTVFGATGATGSILTKILLDNGHEITAYVRNLDKMTHKHPKLKVVKGDIYDISTITDVLLGQDLVISCLGSDTMKQSDQLTIMAESIATSMKNAEVSRIIYMATAGIENEFKGLYKLFIRMILGNVIDDHQGAANFYKKAGLDYTIIRPMQLKDGSATGNYETAKVGLPKSRKPVTRADVASFMAKVVIDESYIKSSVGIAGR